MTYADHYKQGRDTLKSAGIVEADLDARLLLEFICGTDRNTLLVHGDMELTPEQEERYGELISRRAERIPLQHLTGSQNFMGMEFLVDENVLIPRQDTEILVEEALGELHDGSLILDMCTGSGCILTSLLALSNSCFGMGVDISEAALEVAWNNLNRLLPTAEKLMRCKDPGEAQAACEEMERDNRLGFEKRAYLVKSDLFENITGKFDMIVSNPPYIKTGDIEGLMPEVREHDPRLALDGCEDGLEFYRRITSGAREHLVKEGKLFYEIGCDQGPDVKKIMEDNGFVEVNIVKDYGGLDRVVYGTLLNI